MLSDDEIMTLYTTKVKLPATYFTQYKNVPPCPVRRWNYAWQEHDYPRVPAILDFKSWISKYNIAPETLAYTCGDDPELEFIKRTNAVYLPYPEYDLHTIGTRYTNAFDFFLFNQTLEHLQKPFTAVQSIYETMKPGGYCFTSVPTINIPHSTPYHYGGINPMGLAILFKQCGFEIMEIGQWGNLQYLKTIFERQDWVGYTTLNRNGIVPNEEANVCQCWILAKKPHVSDAQI
jgi:hypothetical protein